MTDEVRLKLERVRDQLRTSIDTDTSLTNNERVNVVIAAFYVQLALENAEPEIDGGIAASD